MSYTLHVDDFINAAVDNLPRAEQLLAAHPEIAHAGFYVSLVLGDAPRVEHAITTNPALSSPGGPKHWSPLLYVCFSRFANPASRRATHIVDTARLLLQHGADPNSAWTFESCPLSCLYGATGLNNNPTLALALLEAGANPNDGESLYHSTEHPDLACLKLLLAHGATPHHPNVLKHLLDREDPEALRLILAAGADPNEPNPRGETSLHWAVYRRRSPALLGILLDHGVNKNAQRQDGRTAYSLAYLTGQTATTEFLRSRGVNTGLSPLDRFLGDCMTTPSEHPAAPPPILPSPEIDRLLVDLTEMHCTPAVKALLDGGVPVNALGLHGATPLHWACWKGYPDLVALLLSHGASLTIEDTQYHATPLGWLEHGSQYCRESGSDHPQVARLLNAAG